MRKFLFSALLTVFLLFAASAALWQGIQLRDIRRQLDEIQRQALHQSAEEMQTLTLALEKLLISTQASRQTELLHAISLSAADVQQHLATLPLEDEIAGSLLTLVGRLQADAAAQLPLLTHTTLSEQHRQQFSKDLAACTRLSAQLALASDTPGTIHAISHADTPPAVILPPAPRGLPDDTVTREEAHKAALDFIGSSTAVIQDAPDVSGILPAYGVTVTDNDLQLNLEITRQGGKVLWMVPETASFSTIYTPEECITAAQDFLLSRGFGETEAVHYQVYDGLCVISAAPLQEGVLLYPDLLTIQVRTDTLQTEGLEAPSYWTHHIPRTLISPTLSAQDALAQLRPGAENPSARLCLLPDGNSETLCWQCTCTHSGDLYYIYIDAHTGEEKAIRKVIPLENGTTEA